MGRIDYVKSFITRQFIKITQEFINKQIFISNLN